MEQKHRDLIKQNFDKLVKVTKDIDKIVELLAEQKILNKYLVEEIFSHADNAARKAEFFQIIQGRGPKAVDHLGIALRMTQNHEAEDILFWNKKVWFSPDPVLQTKPAEKNHIEKRSDVENINKPTISKEKMNEIHVKVEIHPQRKFMDVDEENPPCGTYTMRSYPRGLALLINIYKTEEHRNRIGSEIDVKKLTELFKQLGYELFIHHDLRKREMKRVIRNFATDKKLSSVDSCIIFIMCHGYQLESAENVEILPSDNKSLSTKWITDQFTASNSPMTSSGQRKPKMFFFQACRAKPSMPTVNKRQSEPETDASVFSKTVQEGRDVEDMIIVHSTAPGHWSFRNEETGTWFVDEFVKIVAQNAFQFDLDTMISMVDTNLREKASVYGSQSIDIKKIGAPKKIFFNPGL